jgi:hypothetical protein
MNSMTDNQPGDWAWGPAWRGLRDDVNMLKWLFEEERELTRLYVESVFWALTGKRFGVDDFAREVGFGATAEGPADDPERPAQGALD